jgi:3-hydroxyacyl-CoA dehydrogenase/enoyl-CoA hydratase/3-hydroxybutyryl-CoA epimerase
MVGFGWPLGPFALIDEIGLAVADHAGRTVAAARGMTVAPRAVRLLAEAGLQGKRGGAGFYRYDGTTRAPNPRVYELLGSTVATRAPALEDIGDRLTLLFMNEAARCFDEGVLRSAAEGDLGAVLGLGFPPFLGGPFRWADARGPELREALRALAARHGERYEPAAGLLTGGPFHR